MTTTQTLSFFVAASVAGFAYLFFAIALFYHPRHPLQSGQPLSRWEQFCLTTLSRAAVQATALESHRLLVYVTNYWLMAVGIYVALLLEFMPLFWLLMTVLPVQFVADFVLHRTMRRNCRRAYLIWQALHAQPVMRYSRQQANTQ